MAMGVPLSPALLLVLPALVFYFRLDIRYGIAMTLFLATAALSGALLARESTAIWLWSAVGAFVIGWVFQFIGHAFEGRKPAFVDDIVGLVIGPLFIVAELGFLLRLRCEVREEIERRAGGTHTSKATA